jgi:hypothetical protein
MADLRLMIHNRIFQAPDNVDRHQLLIQQFEAVVAGMLEKNITDNKNRIEMGFLNLLKAFVINEFREAKLEEYQLTVKQYEDLFSKTMRDILNTVDHDVETKSAKGGTLKLDKRAYHNDAPTGQKVTPGGIILPAGY